MSIQSVIATINGQQHTLTYNSVTGKYEAPITAPSASSYPQANHYFPVSVTAEDTAGNSTTVNQNTPTLGTNLRLFVKEQFKPTIRITSPSSGAYLINANPTITFQLRDNGAGQSSGFSGIDESTCVVKIDGTAVSGATFTTATGGVDGSLTPATALADGQHTLTIDVDDHDGNHADTVSIVFTVDTVAPTLTLTNPTDGLETNLAQLNITGTTNDATSSPVTIAVTLNGTDQGAVTVNQDGSFSKTITLIEGSNTIAVTATDSAGKTTTINRTVTLSTTAPVITSVTIAPNPVNAGATYVISVEVE